MTKNDFDIDFDFEEEYGFDPKAFLSNDEYDENIDLTEFTDEELGLHAPEEMIQAEEEPDLEDFDLDEELAEEAETFPAGEPEEELPYDPLEDFDQETYDEEEEPQEEEDMDQEFREEEQDYQEQEAPEEEVPAKKPRQPKPKKAPRPKKEFHTPKFLVKFYDLYFAPLSNKSMLDEPQDPNNPRRRRRKSRSQIFKEVYLPPILVCLCAVLVLSFLMGSVGNMISQYKVNKADEEIKQSESLSAAEQAQQQYQMLLSQAEALAASYDYQGAYDLLDSFQGSATDFPEAAAKKAEYAQTISQLVEYKDPSTIPNLSFYVLINDMTQAKKSTEFGGLYNKNFVTTKEFIAILNDIYNRGYVLVNFDNFISSNKDTNGNDMYFVEPIYLPEGKKPIMLTQTLVNYFRYMIGAKDDWKATASGDSFANKLVLRNGEIKAEYVDAEGNTLVGDYDFVPILETFIQAHPDFSYQGARATLGVTGGEGIFGYRINTDLISTMGNEFHDEQVARAKEIVQALRAKGYRIACNTFGNKDYKQLSVQQIQEDLKNWKTQVTPVLGDVDTLVFARESNISDYTGNAFNVLYTEGFRFFVSNGKEPWAEVNSSFVRQNRLMVTGNTMAWHREYFDNIFDCRAVLDVAVRGDVPNG